METKLKTIMVRSRVFAFSVLIIVILFLFSGCPEIPVGGELDFIPEIAFGTSISRVIVDTSVPEDYALAVYSFNGPLITSFKKNTSYKEGDEYYIPLFDTQMDFSIIPLGNDEFHFKGVMADGSGYLNVYYSQSNKIFSFDQLIYIDALDAFELIIYAEGSDIALDNNGYFHSLYNASYVIHIPEVTDPPEDAEPEAYDLVSGTYEIYRGIMNSSGATGTGLAYYSDPNTDPSVGTRFYSSMNSFDPTSVSEAPDTVSLAEMAGWKTYLSSNTVLALDSDLATWQVFYKFDSQSYPKGLNSFYEGGTYGIDTMLDAFSTNVNGDDMSTWGSVSLLVDAMQ